MRWPEQVSFRPIGRPSDRASRDSRRGDRAPDWRRPYPALDGSQESIIVYAGVGLSIFSMLAMSSIYVLRWRRPDLTRPFRTPGYPVTPAIYLFLTALLTAATFHDRPEVSCYALVSILAGVPFYYIWQEARHRRPSLDALRRIPKLIMKRIGSKRLDHSA